MTICRNPNCAKENTDDTVFCRYCGRRLKEPKNYSKLPLKMVGILAGFIVLLIIFKISFGGPKDNINPETNKGVNNQQNDLPKNTESELRYKFVFVRGKGTTKEIYLHNMDGTTEQLTNSNLQNIYPSISPDGTKIAFERIEDSKSNIYVMNIDGTGEKKLTEGQQPTWSANSAKIFYYNKDISSISKFLFSIKPDGSDKIRETNTTDSYNMARVSPDGSKIALTKYSIEGWGIYTVDPDLSGRKTLVLEKNELGNPVWSNDGNLVIYQSMKNGNYDIYSVDLNKNVKRLTDSNLPEISPSFTTDGKILFTREEMGTFNIYIMDIDGKNQKQVLKDAAFASTSIK